MTDSPAPTFRSQLQPGALGLILCILTVLFGQGLGVAFGVNEDAIKDKLKADANAVKDTFYKSDDAQVKAVVSQSWNYMKRAHLHGGGIGTTGIALILTLAFFSPSRLLTRLTAIALGAGGLGYSLFWMWAGFRAPGLGGTHAAKESLNWLAMPSAGLIVIGTLSVLFVLIGSLFCCKKCKPPATPTP
jgi:hypothetical protein